jgi:hypothetical protein
MLEKFRNQTLAAMKDSKELMEFLKENDLKMENLQKNNVEITMQAHNALFFHTQPLEEKIALQAAEEHNVSLGSVFPYFYTTVDSPDKAMEAAKNVVEAKKTYYRGMEEIAKMAIAAARRK